MDSRYSNLKQSSTCLSFWILAIQVF